MRRPGRNPKTGEPYKISDRNVVSSIKNLESLCKIEIDLASLPDKNTFLWERQVTYWQDYILRYWES